MLMVALLQVAWYSCRQKMMETALAETDALVEEKAAVAASSQSPP